MNIVYIACPGHSGSTLLDMLLGVHEDVFSTGELVHLPNQYHRNKLFNLSPLNGLVCSCKKGFFECDFWGRFIQELDKHQNYDVINKPLKFKTAFLMDHTIPHLKISHKILRLFIYYSIKYKLSIVDVITKFLYKKRISNNEFLFKLIHQISEAEYIVDSSKDIYRLNYLIKSNIPIKVVVLQRDILGVTASSLRKNSKLDPISIARSGWVKYYKKLDTILRYNNIQPIIIGYEELVDDTLVELNKIYNYIGLNELEQFDGSFNTHDYHLAAGNGLRYRGEIKIKKDEKWKQVLSTEDVNKINKLKTQLKGTLFE